MRTFLPQTKKNENGRDHGEWQEAIRPENHHYANEQVIRVFEPSIYITTPKIFYLHIERYISSKHQMPPLFMTPNFKSPTKEALA